MNEKEHKIKESSIDVKNKVLQKIKEKNIKMRHPFIFLAQKLGLHSVLALAIICGSLLVSIGLYFFKKTGVLKFLSLGWPGLKIVLISLPYDYIALFIFTILVASYIIHQLDLSHGIKLSSNAVLFSLLVVTILIGSFFAVNGIEQIIKGWSKNKVPEDIAVAGRILEYSPGQAIIQEENGRDTEVILKNGADTLAQYKFEYMENKVLRAVGKRDKNDSAIFYAEQVECCEDN